MKFVAGLGNPGKRYENTRHNIGFLVIDRLARESECELSKTRSKALYGRMTLEGHPVLLVKPQNYMNLSGVALESILDFFKGTSEDLLVVHDDLDLPLGQLRFRARGSSGGHRGVQSVIDSLGTTEFHRLKLGIGRDARLEATDFVLSPFDNDECNALDDFVSRAQEAVRLWVRDGFERCAREFNVRLTKGSHDKETAE